MLLQACADNLWQLVSRTFHESTSTDVGLCDVVEPLHV